MDRRWLLALAGIWLLVSLGLIVGCANRDRQHRGLDRRPVMDHQRFASKAGALADAVDVS